MATFGVVALPWVSVYTHTPSGYQMIGSETGLGFIRYLPAAPFMVLIGGVLALAGGAATIANKMSRYRYLIPIGGLLVVLGCVWVISWANTLSGFAYGFYACLVGGILALIGTLGLKR